MKTFLRFQYKYNSKQVSKAGSPGIEVTSEVLIPKVQTSLNV